METDNLKAAAESCRKDGLSDSSKLMSDLASNQLTAYLVVERNAEYGDDIYYLAPNDGGGRPANVHLTVESAKSAAQLATARKLRRESPFAYGFNVEDVLTISISEFEAKVGKILGMEFKVPGGTGRDLWCLEPVFPTKATDEQLLEIAKFLKIEFYDIVETKVMR